jgi:topoisomerase IA-like protein
MANQNNMGDKISDLEYIINRSESNYNNMNETSNQLIQDIKDIGKLINDLSTNTKMNKERLLQDTAKYANEFRLFLTYTKDFSEYLTRVKDIKNHIFSSYMGEGITNTYSNNSYEGGSKKMKKTMKKSSKKTTAKKTSKKTTKKKTSKKTMKKKTLAKKKRTVKKH